MGNGGEQIRSDVRRIRRLSGSIWVGLYVFFAALPLILLLLGPVPKGGGRWWDLAMGLGFSGLAMIGLQFILTARFRRLTAPFGIDIIYYFHRWAAVSAFSLLLIHYLVLKLAYPDSLAPASPLAAAPHMTAGRVSLALFAVLIISSLWRKSLKIEYDHWRVWHGILAAIGFLLAIFHVYGVGYYTGDTWKKWALLAYLVFWLWLLFYIRILRPISLQKKPYRVARVTEERGNSWTISVEPVAHGGLRFHPGQFAWLTLGTSPFRAREHPFSFSGSAASVSTLHFTIKELGDFTRTVKFIKPGTIAYVDGPHGSFTPDLFPDAPGFVLIAGGVGIAPLMSILRTFADRGDRRPLILFYGSSSLERVLFREAIDELKSRVSLKVILVLQEPAADWSGPAGFITRELLESSLPVRARELQFYICGPVAMTRSVMKSLRDLNIPLKRLHFEHFDMA